MKYGAKKIFKSYAPKTKPIKKGYVQKNLSKGLKKLKPRGF